MNIPYDIQVLRNEQNFIDDLLILINEQEALKTIAPDDARLVISEFRDDGALDIMFGNVSGTTYTVTLKGMPEEFRTYIMSQMTILLLEVRDNKHDPRLFEVLVSEYEDNREKITKAQEQSHQAESGQKGVKVAVFDSAYSSEVE